MKKLATIALIFLFALTINAQDSTTLPPKFALNGYIKDMQTLTFDKYFNNLITGNLIHNRLNFKWKPSTAITAVAELRTRFFWGEEVKYTPNFTEQLSNPNEKVNMQKVWIDDSAIVFLTNVERLYVDYRNAAWNARIGRQRINWGLTTTWNPNDIFNTYNFLDFDYEERPGTDAGKLEYAFSSSFKTEMVYAHSGSKDGSVAALRYYLNKWGYDMQLITGWYNMHPTLGAGWAGSIKDAGFKGEMQYFFGNKDSGDHLNMSLEADYMFKKGWYVNASMLFNEKGLQTPFTNWDTIQFKLTPENLMPTKWNIMLSTSKAFTPLLSANLSVVYAPGTNLVILLPSLQYNLATNLDINLVWQSFFAEQNKNIEAINHRCYLRFKWSF
jgi:hypothetical protein